MQPRKRPDLTTDEVRRCEELFNLEQPPGAYGEGVDTPAKVRTLLARCGQFVSEARLAGLMAAELPQWVPPLGLAQLLRLMTAMKREFVEDPMNGTPNFVETLEASDAFEYLAQNRAALAAMQPLDPPPPKGAASPLSLRSTRSESGAMCSPLMAFAARGLRRRVSRVTLASPTSPPHEREAASEPASPRGGGAAASPVLGADSPRSVMRRRSRATTVAGSVPSTPGVRPASRGSAKGSPLAMPAATRRWEPSATTPTRPGRAAARAQAALSRASDTPAPAARQKTEDGAVSKESLQHIVEQFGLAYDVWEELDEEGIAVDSTLLDRDEFGAMCTRLSCAPPRQAADAAPAAGVARMQSLVRHRVSMRLVRRLSRGDAVSMRNLKAAADRDSDDEMEMEAEDLIKLLSTPSLAPVLPPPPDKHATRTLQLNETVKKGAHIRKEPSQLKTRSEMISDRTYPPYAAHGRLHGVAPAAGAFSEWQTEYFLNRAPGSVYQRPDSAGPPLLHSVPMIAGSVAAGTPLRMGVTPPPPRALTLKPHGSDAGQAPLRITQGKEKKAAAPHSGGVFARLFGTRRREPRRPVQQHPLPALAAPPQLEPPLAPTPTTLYRRPAYLSTAAPCSHLLGPPAPSMLPGALATFD
eukprot:TRINITY_DN15417_c0_g1_i1.p1 TRINITY_DN15417_c0_g1~~TRINITY_DN15417_c0_g1_i1.p1  ORF type:complete len:640 (+),score=167.80 TRINITY_DN15417_c0_g1_i1:94-2013(+)